MKNRLRLSLEKSINALFPADTARLLKSLYFGDKNYMDKLTLERYRLAGVMHVLAASGLHVGIIASIPLLLLAPLRVDRRIILTLGVAAAALYLYITDMPVSLMRAFIMFALYGILSVLSIGRSALNTLFLSGALILLMFPDELYGMGFQLSFGATLGILLFHRTFLAMLAGSPRFVGNAMALTLSAQTIVFPVLYFHIGEVNLAGFISNLLVVPAVGLTLVASLGTLAVSPFSGALAAAGRLITHGAATAGSAVAGLMAGAGLHFAAPPAGALLLPYLCYLAPLLPFGLPARARLALLSLSLAAALAVLVHSRPSLPEHADFPVIGGHVHILARADHALVYGSIASIADARDLADHLEENGVATLQLCIPNADFKNLISFGYLVKASTVTGCVLDAGYTFSRAMTDFMEHLGRDSVRPDIRPLNRRLSDNELRGLCETLFRPPGKMSPRLKVSSPAAGFPFLSKLFPGWSGHSSAEKQALSEP
ncbi:MAG TPA: ComEC/Rec2 family competence protein [Spirochaetes bacterium]|nr:ComEC/Rec2 family competence protein [Spirochaetota bacterium]